MKIGILSDTHGHVERTRAAIDRLLAASVKAVLHCGDIGAESVFAELLAATEAKSVPIYAVLGNVDYPDELFDVWKIPGRLEILGRFGELCLSGKKIAIVHGDDFPNLAQAELSGEFDYVFTGHTHVADDSRSGRTRIINPGAVYRASVPSVAVLDLNKDQLTVIHL